MQMATSPNSSAKQQGISGIQMGGRGRSLWHRITLVAIECVNWCIKGKQAVMDKKLEDENTRNNSIRAKNSLRDYAEKVREEFDKIHDQLSYMCDEQLILDVFEKIRMLTEESAELEQADLYEDKHKELEGMFRTQVAKNNMANYAFKAELIFQYIDFEAERSDLIKIRNALFEATKLGVASMNNTDISQNPTAEVFENKLKELQGLCEPILPMNTDDKEIDDMMRKKSPIILSFWRSLVEEH